MNFKDITIMGFAVERPDGKYFGSLRTPVLAYDHGIEFLKRRQYRTLREVTGQP